MKNRRAFAMMGLAIVLGLAAVVLASRWLLRQTPGGVRIVVAAADVNLGQRLAPDMGRLADWPSASLPQGALRDPAQLNGATLPNVDSKRIAFYGLSYGGKTAVRVPPILGNKYAISICSADFNDWIQKNASADDRHSYMFTGEYEMPEWSMGHVASYAELASLMTPRI